MIHMQLRICFLYAAASTFFYMSVRCDCEVDGPLVQPVQNGASNEDEELEVSMVQLLQGPLSIISDESATKTSATPRKIAIEEHFAGHDQERHVNWAGELLKLKEPLLETSEDRLADMDAGDIRIAVLSNTACVQKMEKHFNLTGLNESQIKNLQIGWARQLNNELFAKTKVHERYRGYCNLPMLSPAEAAQELTRCVQEFGFVGALVNGADTSLPVPNYYGTDDYDVLWRTFAELDYPLYLHPGTPEVDKFYAHNMELYLAPWGYEESTARLVLNLMIGRKLFERFPNLKMIIGHMGELLPFEAWRIDHRLRKDGYETDAIVMDTLRKNFYVTTSGFFDTLALQHLIGVMGVDRVLYATDYPYENMTRPKVWFESAVRDLALNQSERDMIEFKNAERLLRISPGAPSV